MSEVPLYPIRFSSSFAPGRVSVSPPHRHLFLLLISVKHNRLRYHPIQLRYRATSLIRKRTPVGPYLRPVPRVIGGSLGDGRCLMCEVPMYFEGSGAQCEETSLAVE